MIRRAMLAVVFCASAAALVRAQQVTFDRLLHADKEPQNWISYSGTLFNQRFSPLVQVTPANVKNLDLQWVWQSKSLEKFEATALVVDGVLYTLQGPPAQGVYEVVALDAVTGRPFWTLEYKPMLEARPCCGRVSRGLAILGDTLYMGTIDAHLVAIDAKTGKILWDHTVEKVGDKVTEKYAITHAPVIVKDKVIVGIAGGDLGVRGFICAFDAKDGHEIWRTYTIPAKGEAGNETWSGDSWKTGGAGVWNSGAYDAETNLVYFGTGNPAPDWDGRERLGDNLYSDSVLALDADTGRLKWHYQFTPHDEVDYDSTQVPVLVDIQWQGTPRKVMLWANRNGLAYVIDRVTGEFLLGKPYVKVNWMDGFDPKGRPMRIPGQVPSQQGTLIMPTVLGATNWAPPSYSPRTGFFYVAGWENTGTFALEGRYADGAGHADAQLQKGRRGLRLHPRPGSARPDAEVGIQDERHHVGRRAHDGVGRPVRRRQGRLLLRARRANGRPPLEGSARRAGEQRTDVVLGQRQAVRDGRGRQFVVRLRVAAVRERGDD
jgi:alcohol dehydrogenase (cytochrome c)